MSALTDFIAKKIYSGQSLEKIPVEKLREAVEKYPYFGLGHFLLTKKLEQTGENEKDAVLQKTSLYFQDPLWLKWLMDEKETTSYSPSQKTEPEPSIEMEESEEEYAEPTADIIVEPEVKDSFIASAVEDAKATSIAEPAAEAPLFEPYHTIDYFASQGIKISGEVKPEDRFGQQLRSFTEWLKTMKKIPPAQREDEEEETKDRNVIQQIAEHSLEQKEVVTEAMAEVLEKQNRIEEARELYNKLSLLNPAKSAYFAAKIAQLKEK